MWPWEHAAIGYLLLSAGHRLSRRPPPTAAAAVAVLVGTQLPDLVDKPLSWGLGIFPSGFAIGHSALVALPLGAIVLAVAHRTEHHRLAAAFIMGYWSHLGADVITPLRFGQAPDVRRVLWPIVTMSGYDQDYGLARGVIYFRDFLEELSSLEPTALVGLYLLLPTITVLVWLFDGAPGWAILTRGIK